MGLLDMFLGERTPAAAPQGGPAPTPAYSEAVSRMAAQYGIDPAMVADMQRQKRYEALGHIGATLLAAGQPGPIGQRGQILSNLGRFDADIGSDLTEAQAAQARRMQVEEAQSAAARRAEAVKILQSLTEIPAGVKALAEYDPETALNYYTKILEEQRAEEQRQRELAEERQRNEEFMRSWGGGSPAPTPGSAGGGAPVGPRRAAPTPDMGTGLPSWMPPPSTAAPAGAPVRGPVPTGPGAQRILSREDVALLLQSGASPEDIAKMEYEERLLRTRPEERTEDMKEYEWAGTDPDKRAWVRPPPLGTADMQEYEWAKGDPDKRAWLLEQNRAKGTQITNTVNPAEKPDPLAAGLDDYEGKLYTDYLKQGPIAAAAMQDLEVLRALNEQAWTGPLVGNLQRAFPGLSTVGQAFEAIVSRSAPTMRVEGSGSTSDIEYAGMLRSYPSLIGSREGNELIIQTMMAKRQIDMERAQAVRDFQNSGRTREDAVALRQRLTELDQRSILSPELRTLFGVGEAGDAPAPPPSFDGTPEEWKFLTPEERQLWQN